MYGRVRPWDGLIGILRTAVRLLSPHLMKVIKTKTALDDNRIP